MITIKSTWSWRSSVLSTKTSIFTWRLRTCIQNKVQLLATYNQSRWNLQEVYNQLDDESTMVLYLINICHHNLLDFRNLNFYCRKFANLFWMFHTILHMLLQLGSTPYTTKSSYYCNWKQRSAFAWLSLVNINTYPNSLFRPLGAAVAALPPSYLFVKSSLMRSRKAIAIWRPVDSTATTQ